MKRILFLFLLGAGITSAQVLPDTSTLVEQPDLGRITDLLTVPQRGMYVDCFDQMIKDINDNSAGEAWKTNGGPTQQLVEYAKNNGINYMALYKLDGSTLLNAQIMTDPNYKDDLAAFINHAKSQITGLKIGVVGSGWTFFENNFSTTPVYYFGSPFHMGCGTATIQQADLRMIANPPMPKTPSDILKSELVKFYLNTNDWNSTHADKIDIISLEHEYWTSAFVNDPNGPYAGSYQLAYDDHITILKAMHSISCASINPIIRVEDEVGPFTGLECPPNGQTPYEVNVSHLGQALELDRYVDRLLVNAYSSDNYYNSTTGQNGAEQLLFDWNCYITTLFASANTKSNSEIWPLFSVEKPTFSFCDNSATPNNLLGKYLTERNGTMAKAENNEYLPRYNTNVTTACPACNAEGIPYKRGNNKIGGFMWFPYTMMKNNSVSKLTSVESSFIGSQNKSILSPNPAQNFATIEVRGEKADILVMNIEGKVVEKLTTINKTTTISTEKLENGIYFIKIIENGIETAMQKLVILK